VFRRDQQGFYFFVGRADDMFVCGGENIYPAEVERLLERHPRVAQATVVAAPDDIKGEIPIGFVVLTEPDSASEEELKQYALDHGPAYSHPRAIVLLDRLPVGGTHKIDRGALLMEARKIAEKRRLA
jgi:acyl-coenzyme A synthetase/AMP-(fatty) acid ligase